MRISQKKTQKVFLWKTFIKPSFCIPTSWKQPNISPSAEGIGRPFGLCNGIRQFLCFQLFESQGLEGSSTRFDAQNLPRWSRMSRQQLSDNAVFLCPWIMMLKKSGGLKLITWNNNTIKVLSVRGISGHHPYPQKEHRPINRSHNSNYSFKFNQVPQTFDFWCEIMWTPKNMVPWLLETCSSPTESLAWHEKGLRKCILGDMLTSAERVTAAKIRTSFSWLQWLSNHFRTGNSWQKSTAWIHEFQYGTNILQMCLLKDLSWR